MFRTKRFTAKVETTTAKDSAPTTPLPPEVEHDPATARAIEPSLDSYFASPRWSPNGDRIAVAHWSRPGRFDIEIRDAERISRSRT